MEKVSHEDMVKVARHVGVARAFIDHGYQPETVKYAFVEQGYSQEYAEGVVKEAFGPLGGFLGRIGGWAGRAASGIGGKGGLAKTVGAWGNKGFQMGGTRGKIQQWLGQKGTQALRGTQKGLSAFEASPGKALWGGAKNFGQGALFMGGKGIGGTLGKGAFGYGMYSMLKGPGGQPRQQAPGYY